MEINHHINQETCKRCGLCAEICPNRIIDKKESRDLYFREDRLGLCIRCGQT